MQYSNSIDHRLTGRHEESFRFVGNVKNKIILDIGCSYGWFERWAIRNYCKKIIGIEPDEDNLKFAKDAVSSATFAKGSALCVPSEKDYFDVVVMWEVLEHLPKNTESKSFQEINRILKLGGCLFLSTPNKVFWSCVLDPAWWLVGHRHYNINELRQIFQNTNFEVVKIEYGGGFYELFSMILLYIFKWSLRREMPFKKWFDKKRDMEFSKGTGFTNIFIEARKSHD